MSRGSNTQLPDWLPREVWNDFKEMRRLIKAPMTLRAETLLLRKLSRMRADGQDPIAVVEQSIEMSWRGLFPVKHTATGFRARSQDDSYATH